MEQHDHGTNDDLPWPRAEVPTTPFPEVRNRAAKGFSRLESKMFADDNGVYPAIGATFMYAAQSAEVDEARLIRNLDWLSQNGCNYIRILLMVGTPPSPYWPFEIKPRSWDAYHRVMELAWERRMRTQPVIFADAQAMTSGTDRETFVGEVAQFCNDRREMVQFIEVANESEWNGVSMDELTRYCEILSRSTDIPFAASSPHGDSTLHDKSLEKLYGEHGCRSPIATPHFNRKAREDGYRIVRQPWHYQFIGHPSYMPSVFVNNEPAGPGVKQGGVTEPEQIGMAALYTFLSGGAAYCFHSLAGVKGFKDDNQTEVDFSDTPRGNEMWHSIRSLVANVPTNIANGNNANHHWTIYPRHPLEPSLNNQIWPDGRDRGLVRAFAQGFGPEWYVGLLGIRGSIEFAPNRDVDATLYHPISGKVVWNWKISRGERVRVEPDGETRSYLLKTVDDSTSTTAGPAGGKSAGMTNQLSVVKEVAAEIGYPKPEPKSKSQRIAEVHELTKKVAVRLHAKDSNWGRRRNDSGAIGKDTVAYRTLSGHPYSIDIVAGSITDNPRLHWAEHGVVGGVWIKPE